MYRIRQYHVAELVPNKIVEMYYLLTTKYKIINFDFITIGSLKIVNPGIRMNFGYLSGFWSVTSTFRKGISPS